MSSIESMHCKGGISPEQSTAYSIAYYISYGISRLADLGVTVYECCYPMILR